MYESVDLTMDGQDWTVSGEYTAPYGGDRDTPDSPGGFIIDSVELWGVECKDWLSENTIQRLANLAYEQLEDTL